MQCEELVILILSEEVISGGSELKPKDKRKDSTYSKEEQSVNHVQRTHLLVVGTGQVIADEWPEFFPFKCARAASTIEDPSHTTERDGGHEENGTSQNSQSSSLFNRLWAHFSVESVVHVSATGTITIHRVGVQDEFGPTIHRCSPLNLPFCLIVTLARICCINTIVCSTPIWIDLDHFIDIHQCARTGPEVESTKCQSLRIIS